MNAVPYFTLTVFRPHLVKSVLSFQALETLYTLIQHFSKINSFSYIHKSFKTNLSFFKCNMQDIYSFFRRDAYLSILLSMFRYTALHNLSHLKPLLRLIFYTSHSNQLKRFDIQYITKQRIEFISFICLYQLTYFFKKTHKFNIHLLFKTNKISFGYGVMFSFLCYLNIHLFQMPFIDFCSLIKECFYTNQINMLGSLRTRLFCNMVTRSLILSHINALIHNVKKISIYP